MVKFGQRLLALGFAASICGIAIADITYLTQSRSASAQGPSGGVVASASAPDFAPFNVRLNSPGEIPDGLGAEATASQFSTLAQNQILVKCATSPGGSGGHYGNASSNSLITFSVPSDSAFSMQATWAGANISLSGPGVNIIRSGPFLTTITSTGTFQAGQTYTLSCVPVNEISAGSIRGGFADVIVTIGTPPSTPVNPKASVAKICPGLTTSNLSVNNPGAGIVVDWYLGGCAETPVGTGNPLTVSAAGDYYAKTRRLSDGLRSLACASVTVGTYTTSNPTGASANRNNLCPHDPGMVQLSIVGGLGQFVRWYADSCSGTPIGEGISIPVPSPRRTTIYYGRWVNNCAVSACASVAVVVRDCAADFNCDGVVQDDDFALFAIAYNVLVCSDPAMPTDCPSDINQDGFVDDADFAAFAVQYDRLICP
ncbi:MAG: hypothetical protein JNK16_02720 [Phycisphaerales bacterium]|nr:hypothetical protein [Phycisphaerales bacterium]